MHATLKQWLDELEEEIALVTSSDINNEAHGNMVTFGFDEELLNQWGEDSISAFLESCYELYKRKSSETKLVFYSWLDEKASQIRISAVSQSHGKLPFRNKIAKVGRTELVKCICAIDSGVYKNGILNVWHKNL